MFYKEEIDDELRFGDVLKGYISVNPEIETPFINGYTKDYNINVLSHKYYVIMDPCCSIGSKMITLTPLIKLYGGFYRNPYFSEDLTRINIRMEPHLSLPPQAWEQLSDEEKIIRIQEGSSYALYNLFVYKDHEYFEQYEIPTRGDNIFTKYYMINFKNLYHLKCDKINDNRDAPVESKILQLTNNTRSNLREKISEYFIRIPEEELIED